mmetsp:Transcript_4853/g.5463  ORF Transcript_4853/g.5463 Transcript_4853/m.5463 type:complete len:88 (-) Transcript_4853:48-311(-)
MAGWDVPSESWIDGGLRLTLTPLPLSELVVDIRTVCVWRLTNRGDAFTKFVDGDVNVNAEVTTTARLEILVAEPAMKNVDAREMNLI